MRITKPGNLNPDISPPENNDNVSSEKKNFFHFLNRFKLFFIIFFLGLFYWLWQSQWIISYGRITAPVMHLSSTQIGRISEIKVKEGEQVKAGQLVALLESQSLTALLEKNKLQLKKGQVWLSGLASRGINPAINAQIDKSKKILEEALQRLKGASADYQRSVKTLKLTRLEEKRIKNLKVLDSVTQKQWETTKQSVINAQAGFNIAKAFKNEQQAAYKRAEVNLAEAKQHLVFSQSKLYDTIHLQQLENQRLEFQVLEIQAQLRETQIIAPRDGRVSWINKYRGDVVDHNDIILNIMEQGKTWVEAFVDTDEWGDVYANQVAMIKAENSDEAEFIITSACKKL